MLPRRSIGLWIIFHSLLGEFIYFLFFPRGCRNCGVQATLKILKAYTEGGGHPVDVLNDPLYVPHVHNIVCGRDRLLENPETLFLTMCR